MKQSYLVQMSPKVKAHAELVLTGMRGWCAMCEVSSGEPWFLYIEDEKLGTVIQLLSSIWNVTIVNQQSQFSANRYIIKLDEKVAA